MPSLEFELPVTTLSVAKQMFGVSDDKLRVKSHLHTALDGSQFKAADRVVSVDGVTHDSPEGLLMAGAADKPVVLQLQRDRISCNLQKS